MKEQQPNKITVTTKNRVPNEFIETLLMTLPVILVALFFCLYSRASLAGYHPDDLAKLRLQAEEFKKQRATKEAQKARALEQMRKARADFARRQRERRRVKPVVRHVTNETSDVEIAKKLRQEAVKDLLQLAKEHPDAFIDQQELIEVIAAMELAVTAMHRAGHLAPIEAAAIVRVLQFNADVGPRLYKPGQGLLTLQELAERNQTGASWRAAPRGLVRGKGDDYMVARARFLHKWTDKSISFARGLDELRQGRAFLPRSLGNRAAYMGRGMVKNALTGLVFEGRVDNAMNGYVKNFDVHLIMMASGVRSGLGRLVLGTVFGGAVEMMRVDSLGNAETNPALDRQLDFQRAAADGKNELARFVRGRRESIARELGGGRQENSNQHRGNTQRRQNQRRNSHFNQNQSRGQNNRRAETGFDAARESSRQAHQDALQTARDARQHAREQREQMDRQRQEEQQRVQQERAREQKRLKEEREREQQRQRRQQQQQAAQQKKEAEERKKQQNNNNNNGGSNGGGKNGNGGNGCRSCGNPDLAKPVPPEMQEEMNKVKYVSPEDIYNWHMSDKYPAPNYDKTGPSHIEVDWEQVKEDMLLIVVNTVPDYFEPKSVPRGRSMSKDQGFTDPPPPAML